MRRSENRTLLKLKNTIAEHLDDATLSIEYLCQQVGVSRSQLHRILKQEEEVSLSHFIREQRMAKARDLLTNTEMRISEVADAVGVNSHQNFTKYFKEAYGLNPSDFRAQQSEAIPGSSEDPDNTIAVLPFVNYGNDKEQEYFSDGITEEIINVLSNVSALKVVGRTSSFAFKNKTADLRAIGKSLGVNHILEGSVRRAGNRVRITAQLVKAEDGYHLWSEKYDFELTDLFDIQDAISAAILEEIKDELLGGLEHEVLKRRVIDPEAHEYYLKGLYFLNKYSSTQNFTKAINYFEKALRIEPDFVECLSDLSSCYVQLWFFSQKDASESVEKAIQVMTDAYKIEKANPSLMVREAHIKTWYHWDISGAIALFKKALILSPHNPELYLQLSSALTISGDYDRAEMYVSKAIALDPLAPVSQFGYAWTKWYRGDLNGCEKIVDKLIAFKPRFWAGHYMKGVVYIETNRSSEALMYAVKATELYPSSMTYALMAQTHLLNGDFAACQELVSKIEHQLEDFPVSNFDLGHLYMGLGQFEKSRDYYQKAIDNHEGRMLFLLPSCRKIPFVAKHPYFKALFDKMKTVAQS